MKRFNLPKVVGAGIVAVGLALTPLTLSAIAQNSPDSPEQTTPTEQNDRDFDWGWLGLLGLAGLAGLRKKQEAPTQYRDSR